MKPSAFGWGISCIAQKEFTLRVHSSRMILFTKVHGVTFQKTIILILTAISSSHLTLILMERTDGRLSHWWHVCPEFSFIINVTWISYWLKFTTFLRTYGLLCLEKFGQFSVTFSSEYSFWLASKNAKIWKIYNYNNASGFVLMWNWSLV
jgi:hypothetical protein